MPQEIFSVLVLPSLAATSLQVLPDSFCGYGSKLLSEGLVSLPTSVAGGAQAAGGEGGAAAAGQIQRLGVSSSCNVGLGCANK